MMKTARPATPSAHPASTSDKRCRLWTIWCQNRSSDKSDRECGLGGNSYLLFHVSSICGARILYPRCITDLEIEFYLCMLTGMQYCHQKWVSRVIFCVKKTFWTSSWRPNISLRNFLPFEYFQPECFRLHPATVTFPFPGQLHTYLVSAKKKNVSIDFPPFLQWVTTTFCGMHTLSNADVWHVI